MIHRICSLLILLLWLASPSWAALSRTTYTIQSSSTGHGTGSYTTGSFTSESSGLLVVAAYFMTNSGSGGADRSGDLTISDSAGLTWTPRVNAGNADLFAIGARVWTAPVTAGGSMTVTIDCGANSIYAYQVHIYSYTGYNTSTPTGATATGTHGSTSGNFTDTLSAAPASTSEVVGVLAVSPGQGTTDAAPGTGWTEIYQSITDWDHGSQSQVRAGSTSTAVAWGTINGTSPLPTTVEVALEIKEGTGGGGGGGVASRGMLLGVMP